MDDEEIKKFKTFYNKEISGFTEENIKSYVQVFQNQMEEDKKFLKAVMKMQDKDIEMMDQRDGFGLELTSNKLKLKEKAELYL